MIPPDAGAWLAEAVRQHGAGELEAAAASYRQALALRPDIPAALNNLGMALRGLGRLDEAMACYRRALALAPDFPEAHNNLGLLHRDRGALDEAAASHRLAVAAAPRFAQAHNNLGVALREQGLLEEARAACAQAIALKPDYWEAHSNLGNVLQDQSRLEAAVSSYGKALRLAPDAADLHSNMGGALTALGRPEDAIASYRRALALRPGFPEARNSLGTALRDAGRPEEALACFRQAVALRPDYPMAHANLAMALLARGDFAAGWQEYEWRWHLHATARPRSFPTPQWRGEPAANRRLLLHSEQGLGDTLQFCRYAPLAATRGFRVSLHVQHSLVRLLRSLPGVEQVAGTNDPAPEHDLHCPLLSLPLAFGTTPATIPASPAYLRADPAQQVAWQARLAGVDGLRVGLAWAGNPRLTADRRRSIPPEQLAPLAGVPGLRLFSVQKAGPAPPASLPLTDCMAEMTDFADTAALVANLDLVVSVDTAVAHLAAALGRPAWLLDRFDSCWRWPAGQQGSAWYPTLKIHRQPRPGEWGAVVARVAQDLRAISSA